MKTEQLLWVQWVTRTFEKWASGSFYGSNKLPEPLRNGPLVCISQYRPWSWLVRGIFVKLQNLLWNSSLLFVVAWHPRFCPRSFVLWLHIYHGVVLLVADRNSWILCHIPVHQAHLCSCENWLRWSTMQRTNL